MSSKNAEQIVAKVLLVEDEVELREELARFLLRSGHQVIQAGSLAEFAQLQATVDIAILDIGLPDGTGLDVAQLIRSKTPRTGIIMLTARSSTQDMLSGLNGGADHYLVKPFRLLELNAIINALYRRIGGDWCLNLRTRRLLSAQGLQISLSLAELELFQQLATAGLHVLNRRDLVEAMGYNWLEFDMRRLDTMISRLRKRWADETGTALPLKTEHGKGYSFLATITVVQ
ncbi:response regulator transcription factor [Aquitalea sp. LB_tupeE]|uniref:response regulator transcription factor n=1 Tax=Aquitalea sp. LB_tupeE TaxID=2748078 RepID=UPI002102DE53|nr:response regulator transcription factor [Aquitalea sp. LB_tupeE]